MSTVPDAEDHERAPNSERLELTLFVSGTSSTSAETERRLRGLCDQHAASGYDLRVVDIYEQPAEVFSRGVLAVPTLFKERPLPVRMLIGDFTDEDRVLVALGLPGTTAH